MTDPTRPTTVTEAVARLRALCANCEEPECQCCRDTIAACDAADALSTAQALASTWEAKATAAIEQRDAAVTEVSGIKWWLDGALEANRSLNDEYDELRTASERLQGLLVEMHDALVARSTVLRRQGHPGAARQWGNWAERAAALTPRDPAAQREQPPGQHPLWYILRGAMDRAGPVGLPLDIQSTIEEIEAHYAAQQFESGAGGVDGHAQPNDGTRSCGDRSAANAPTTHVGGKASPAGVEPGPAPDSPMLGPIALPVHLDDESDDLCNMVDADDVVWLADASIPFARQIAAALNASAPAPEAGKPTDGEELASALSDAAVSVECQACNTRYEMVGLTSPYLPCGHKVKSFIVYTGSPATPPQGSTKRGNRFSRSRRLKA